MKKIIVACFAALLLVFGGVSSAQADEYLRVGMEAAYAPFNWRRTMTQTEPFQSKVPNSMPTVMTCRLLKKSLKLKGRNPWWLKQLGQV